MLIPDHEDTCIITSTPLDQMDTLISIKPGKIVQVFLAKEVTRLCDPADLKCIVRILCSILFIRDATCVFRTLH